MKFQIEDSWEGWDGDTIVKLTDGSVWRQDEYYYEYRYSYRSFVTLHDERMHVEGMSRAVRVRRLE